MATTTATSPVARHKCFLCEVPRGPWAMLFDFAEPVCRACCNYEGIDRIREVMQKAKELRKKFDGEPPNNRRSPPQPISQDHFLAHMPPVRAIPSSGGQSPTYAVAFRPGKPNHIFVPTPNGKPPMSFAQTSLIPNGPVVSAPMMAAPIRAILPPGIPIMHKPVEQRPVETAQRFAQIQETLNTLSKSPPFRVRFSKDHSLVGRVIAFDAVCRGSDYELKVFIEYPIGSGTVFQSASGAGRQMYGEFRERLGIGGGFRGASSNGYKDLELERVFGVDDWRVLGELLTEEVRFFRGSVKKDLLPTPFIDPNHPNIPPATLSTTRGFLRNNLLRRRRSSNEDESDVKRPHLDTDDDRAISPKSDKSHSPVTPQSPEMNGTLPTHNGLDLNGIASSPKTPEKKIAQEIMECLLCHRALDDTRFVQCPSAAKHKFCFNCSRDSIKKQSANSTDVYCPSSMKCLVQGSTTPWAFMEQEITTILEAAS